MDHIFVSQIFLIDFTWAETQELARLVFFFF